MLVDVAKYDPLFDHLCRAGDGPVEMTFADVERLVGRLLRQRSGTPPGGRRKPRAGVTSRPRRG